RQRFLARPHRLAPEAEPAIDRAGMQRRQQHAVGIAMDNALYRGPPFVADRVGTLLRRRVEFGHGRQILARDGVIGIVAVDQFGNVARHRDGAARGDLVDFGFAFGRKQAGGDQIAAVAHRVIGHAAKLSAAWRAYKEKRERAYIIPTAAPPAITKAIQRTTNATTIHAMISAMT